MLRLIPALAVLLFRLHSQQNLTLWAGKFDPEGFSGRDEKQVARNLGNSMSRRFLKAVETDRKKR